MLARRTRNRLKEGEVGQTAQAMGLLTGVRNRPTGGDSSGEALVELSVIMEGATDEPVQTDLPQIILRANEKARMQCMVLRREECIANLNKILESVLSSYERDSAIAEAIHTRVEETQLSAPFPTVSEALRLMKEEQKLHASRTDYDDHLATKFSWLTKRLAEETERADFNEQRVIKITECLSQKEASRIAHLKKLRELQTLMTERVMQFRDGEQHSAQQVAQLEETVRDLRERLAAKTVAASKGRMRARSVFRKGMMPRGALGATPMLSYKDGPGGESAPGTAMNSPSGRGNYFPPPTPAEGEESRPSLATGSGWGSMQSRATGAGGAAMASFSFGFAGGDGSSQASPRASGQTPRAARAAGLANAARQMSELEELPPYVPGPVALGGSSGILGNVDSRAVVVVNSQQTPRHLTAAGTPPVPMHAHAHAPGLPLPPPHTQAPPPQSLPTDVAEIARLRATLAEVKAREAARQEKEKLVDKYLETKADIDRRMSGLLASKSTAAASLEDAQVKLKESVAFCTAKAQENRMLAEQVAALEAQLDELRGVHAMQDRETRASYDDLLSKKEREAVEVREEYEGLQRRFDTEKDAHKATLDRLQNLQELVLQSPSAADVHIVADDPLSLAGGIKGILGTNNKKATRLPAVSKQKRRTLPNPGALAFTPPPIHGGDAAAAVYDDTHVQARCEECLRRLLLEQRQTAPMNGAGGWSVGGSRPHTPGDGGEGGLTGSPAVIPLVARGGSGGGARGAGALRACEDCGKALTNQQLQRIGSGSRRGGAFPSPLTVDGGFATPPQGGAAAYGENGSRGAMPPLPHSGKRDAHSGGGGGIALAADHHLWAKESNATILREIIRMKVDEIESLRRMLDIPAVPNMDFTSNPDDGAVGGGSPTSGSSPRTAVAPADDTRYQQLYAQKSAESDHFLAILQQLLPAYEALQRQANGAVLRTFKQHVTSITQVILSTTTSVVQCQHCRQAAISPVQAYPCGHVVCDACSVEIVAKAKGHRAMACPDCKGAVTEFMRPATLTRILHEHKALRSALAKLHRMGTQEGEGGSDPATPAATR